MKNMFWSCDIVGIAQVVIILIILSLLHGLIHICILLLEILNTQVYMADLLCS